MVFHEHPLMDDVSYLISYSYADDASFVLYIAKIINLHSLKKNFI